MDMQTLTQEQPSGLPQKAPGNVLKDASPDSPYDMTGLNAYEAEMLRLLAAIEQNTRK